MKIKYYILIIALTSSYVHTDLHVCKLTEIVVVNSTSSYMSPIHMAVNSADYVNGGVTFTYPVGTFTTVPTVTISVQLKNAAYSSDTSFVAIVTANSANSTTIRINKCALLSFVEAATNDVTVHLSACSSAE